MRQLPQPQSARHQGEGGVERMMRLTVALLFACGPFAAACGTAVAQQNAANWPSKPIHAVVPLAPGTGGDVMARLMLNQLAQQLGQSIVIENKGGAGGTLGAAQVAKADPDGYTLLAHPSTQLSSRKASVAALYKQRSVDQTH